MNKTLILYKSKYGSAAKYAAWLNEALQSDIKTLDAFDYNFNGYEYIVLIGGIYAGGIAGIKKLKKHMPALTAKKLAVLAVGASPYDEAAVSKLKAQNLQETLSGIPLFYARGAYDEQKMKFIDRTLCKALRKSLTKKDPAEFEPWMKALAEAGNGSHDWSDPSQLAPLIEHLKLSIQRESA